MNDETLILYYYGDGLSEEERAAVETALESDAALSRRYRELRDSLDHFKKPPAAPAPAEAVARWHRSIERAAAGARADSRSTGRAWHFPSFAWGALAAALVTALGIGIYLGDRSPPVTSIADRTVDGSVDDSTPMPAAVPVSFSRGMQVHLRETRQDLMRLPAEATTDRALLVTDILRQNRLFEEAARENGAEDIARVLRAFEPVLSRLASEELSDEDAAALKAKLTFELNVMLTKMAQRESHDPETI